MSAPRTQNALALVSLIAGIVAWFAMPLFGAIVAIACGHLARREIRATGQDGDMMALIGLVLGYANLLLSCLGVAVVVLIYFGLFAFVIGAGAMQ